MSELDSNNPEWTGRLDDQARGRLGKWRLEKEPPHLLHSTSGSPGDETLRDETER